MGLSCPRRRRPHLRHLRPFERRGGAAGKDFLRLGGDGGEPGAAAGCDLGGGGAGGGLRRRGGAPLHGDCDLTGARPGISGAGTEEKKKKPAVSAEEKEIIFLSASIHVPTWFCPRERRLANSGRKVRSSDLFTAAT